MGIIKAIPIDLDRPRSILFDMNALAELDQQIDESPFSYIAKAGRDLQHGRVNVLRVLLWAGLIHEDPKLTITGAGKLINFDNLEEVGTAIVKALQEHLPDSKEEQAPLANQPSKLKSEISGLMEESHLESPKVISEE